MCGSKTTVSREFKSPRAHSTAYDEREKVRISGLSQVFLILNQTNEQMADGLQAYKEVLRKIFRRKAKHIVAHFSKKVRIKRKIETFSNNRIEDYNYWFRSWFRMKRGFKTVESARKTISCLTMFQNLPGLLAPVNVKPASISYTQITHIRQD